MYCKLYEKKYFTKVFAIVFPLFYDPFLYIGKVFVTNIPEMFFFVSQNNLKSIEFM